MLIPIVASTFIATFCVVIVLCLVASNVQASPKSELKRRLRQMARQGTKDIPADLRSEIFRELSPVDRFLSSLPLVRGLDKKLDHAGLQISVAGFVSICAGAALLAATLTALATRHLIFALPAAAIALLLPFGFLKLKAAQRTIKFTEQFPEALTMISRSLRAGHSFNTAVQLVGSEMANPLGELFKTAYDQQMLGLRITDGLSNLNHRIDSLDLRFFTTIVSINSEIGGNLADVLEKLAETIKERLRIRKQVRVFTAQGRMSGYVLGALPVITFIIFSFLNPSYETALIKEPLGIYILALAVCMQLMGFFVISKIIKIKI